MHGRVDVDNDAALEAGAWRDAKTGEFEFSASEHFGDHHHDLGGPNVQAYDQIFVFFCHMFTCGSVALILLSGRSQGADTAQTQRVAIRMAQVSRIHRIGPALVA